MAKHEDALRCMALGDERFIRDVLAMQVTNVDASDLDPKTHALVRLGALIALDASPSSFQWNTATALASGATVSGTTSTRRWRRTTGVDGPSKRNTGNR
jgi:hypothetical protein